MDLTKPSAGYYCVHNCMVSIYDRDEIGTSRDLNQISVGVNVLRQCNDTLRLDPVVT